MEKYFTENKSIGQFFLLGNDDDCVCGSGECRREWERHYVWRLNVKQCDNCLIHLLNTQSFTMLRIQTDARETLMQNSLERFSQTINELCLLLSTPTGICEISTIKI